MKTKQRPIVDDLHVERIAQVVLEVPEFASASAETRAETAHILALGFAKMDGHSEEWAQELARKVRARVMWAKPSN